MKINGIDTYEEFGVAEWTVVPSHSEFVNTDSQWISGWASPILRPSEPGLKIYKVTMMIKSDTRQKMWEMGSRFIGALMDPCEIEFNDFDTYFYGVIKDSNHAETVLKRWHKLEVSLIGYEYGLEESFSFSGKTEFSVENCGSMQCPCTLIVYPSADISNFTIYGLTKNKNTGKDSGITFKNLKSGVAVRIDRKTKKVTSASTSVTHDMNMMPVLDPGTNQIRCTSSNAQITILYNPFYV